jgi:putative PEP-CTERM system histidine kinase
MSDTPYALFSAISYVATGFVFLLLALLLMLQPVKGWAASRLTIASVGMVLWAAAMAISSELQHVPFLAVYASEVLRSGVWIYVLASMARRAGRHRLFIGSNALWIIALAAGLLAPLGRYFNILIAPGTLLSWTGLGLSFLCLVLLEQVYRNARVAARSSLNYLVLGIGVLFAYDLFLYSQAQLLGGISAEAWAARGVVNVLAAPLIAIAVRRNPDLFADIFVSRQVVFYTTAFVAVGAYLLLMAVGGYYVRVAGGDWGGIAQLFFFTGAIIVLANLLFSGSMRRYLMVSISKHFFSNKFDYRVEWLRFIRTLSTMDDGDVKRTALRAIAQIFECNRGVLFMRDEERRDFVPAAVWPHAENAVIERQTFAVEDELPAFLARKKWIIDVVEWYEKTTLYDNVALPSSITTDGRWRIVSPLLEGDQLAGFVVLSDPAGPFNLTFEDRDLLKIVGTHVVTLLAQHEADRKLADSRQFEAYNRLTAFVMHDLKNSVAQLKLLVGNAEKHKRNPEFVDDAISTIANTVERMTRLIEQLRSEAITTALRRVDLRDVATIAVQRCSDREPRPKLNSYDGDGYVHADRDRLIAVIEHVIRNAQDATAAHGQVSVEASLERDMLRIRVSDTGSGMDATFLRDRLFRPFDSTKGSRGMGIGAYQVREYVRSLGGDVEVRSSPGQGTTFSLSLPRAAEAATSNSGAEEHRAASAPVVVSTP